MTEYEQLRAALDRKLAADPALRSITKRIRSGTATFKDTAEYAKVLSHILGRELSASVLDLSDRESIASKLLRDCYDDINSVCADVQKSVDEALGLHLKPQKAAYPEERVQQFSHSLIDPTVKDSVIKRRAGAGSETIIKSFHDDFIKKNAQFRTDVGLKCYIIRIGTKCCDWCTEVAGKYEMGDQPDGIFRRHDNCDCTIIYDGQVLRGKQGADGRRSRSWEEVPNADSSYEPKVLSVTDARAVEQRNLAQIRGLKINNSSIDKPVINDIITLRDDNSVYKPVTQEAIDRVPKLNIFDDDEMNKRHQQAAKDLLCEVKRRDDVPVGTEFSIRYDKDMNHIKNETYRQGNVGSAKIEKLDVPFHIFHNHGSGESLSLSDIQSLIDIPNALSITAVGNNGSNFCLSRLEECDYNSYKYFLMNKSKTVIYSANGTDFSLRKLADKAEKEKLDIIINGFSSQQKADLTKAIIMQTDKCLKGGAKYGFKYSKSS